MTTLKIIKYLKMYIDLRITFDIGLVYTSAITSESTI